MDGSVLKKTRESLGKVIKKPPLTEKLLSKPPFRFLHDIITEVIRSTGFMKGLYSDTEMKSENVKERESKMVFLQKAIDVVVMVTGEPLSAKPARIVAGHEPDRTNELLQAIATCCLNKVSSEDAVRRVLSGDKPESKPKASGPRAPPREEVESAARPEEKSKRTKPEETREKEKNGETEPRQRDQRGEDRDGKDRRDKREDRDRRERDKGKDKTRSTDREHKREDRDRERDRDKHRDKERDKERERERDKDREKEKERDKPRDRERDKDREKERDKDKDREKERDKDRDRERERERRRREKEQDRTRSRPREEDPGPQVKPEEPQNAGPEDPPRATTESSARIPRPSSAKGQRRRATVGSQDESDSEGDADAAQKPPEASTEPGPASTDATAAPSRRAVRPSSARPAPPRAKKQESHAEPPAERLSSAKAAAVILDGAGEEEEQNDEDEQFLVQEAVTAATEAPDQDSASAQTEGDSAHGGLVKKILETKKYYEVSPSSPKAQVVNVDSQMKERDLLRREIERLRSSVQTVCRSALPLGKIMDYIQEDMDAMATELTTWRQESREHAENLQRESRLTEGALQPLLSELSQLEQWIQEQQSQICAVRAAVLRNDHKIHRMLTGVNHGNGA